MCPQTNQQTQKVKCVCLSLSLSYYQNSLLSLGFEWIMPYKEKLTYLLENCYQWMVRLLIEQGQKGFEMRE